MLYDAERGDMTIAVVGDAMISRRMRAFRELHFLQLVEIIRSADVSIANLEFLFHDYESSWQWTRGTYTRSDPKNLNELKWMGFDAVLTANNHAYDFDALVYGKPVLPSGRWGLATLEVCLAIMQSATEHRDILMQHQVAVPDGV